MKTKNILEYPFELILKDKTKVVINQFDDKSAKNIKNLMLRIPDEDLQVFNDEELKQISLDWFVNPDCKKLVDIVVTHEKNIIANATLHNEGLYWDNTAELKIFVDPDYRSKGLGTKLFMLLLLESLKNGIKKILVRYLPTNRIFDKIMLHYGIKPETIYNYMSQNLSPGCTRIINIASINLEEWQKRFEFYELLFND